MRNKSINKKIFKQASGCCRICGEKDYALLDVHRIKQGKDGGKYSQDNVVSLCCKCHRKVHDGQMTIFRYYPSSAGVNLLHIIENGEEKFI